MNTTLRGVREHREETMPGGLQGTVGLPYSVHVLDTSLSAACSSPSSLRSDVRVLPETQMEPLVAPRHFGVVWVRSGIGCF